MNANAAPTTSKAQGFALVEVLSVLAIFSVLATIAFFMFVANGVEEESDDGDNGAPHPILQTSEPSSPRQSYSPRIPH